MKELTDIEYVIDIEKSTHDFLVIGAQSRMGNCSMWLELSMMEAYALLDNFKTLEKGLYLAYSTDNIKKIPENE